MSAKSLILSMFLISFFGMVQADTLDVIPNDTLTVYDYHDDIMFGVMQLATTENQFEGKWELVQDSLPVGWKIESFCDNVFCYLLPIPRSSQMNTIYPDDEAYQNPMKFEVYAPDSGMAKIKLRVSNMDDSYSRELVYIFHRRYPATIETFAFTNPIAYPTVISNQIILPGTTEIERITATNIIGETFNPDFTTDGIINTKYWDTGHYILTVQYDTGVVLYSHHIKLP